MKIRWFIIIGILILGIGLCVTGFAATREEFDFDDVQNMDVEFEEKIFNEDITSINCDFKAENIKIVYHDASEIIVNGKKSEKMHYEYRIDSTTKALNIKQVFEDEGFWGIFSLPSFGNSLKNPVIISIPTTVTAIRLKANASNIDIEDITLDYLSIEVNATNLELTDCNIANCVTDVDAGNIEFKNCDLGKIYCDVNAGNVECEIKVSESGEFNVDAGNLDLNLKGNSSIYNVNGNGSGSCIINYDVDAGDADITYVE